jgi:L-cysteine/cystine lyase
MLSINDDLPSTAGVAYLNTGTNGPLPRRAAEAMKAELDRSLLSPRIGPAAYEHLFDLRTRTRAALARTVSAPPEQLALTSSTTHGIGIVVAGIDWRPGDRVVTTTEEHPGLRSPLDVISRRYGVEVVEAPAAELAEHVTEGTRMVAVSHALWTTGRVLDVRGLAEAAHAVGALLLLDGAQSIGAIPVDVPATGADAYAFSGQKWLLGPQGTGGLWVSPDLAATIWTSQSSFWNLQGGQIGRFHDGAARLDGGTLDTPQLAGILGAIEWVESLPGGRAGWAEQTARNAAAARTRLRQVEGLSLAEHDREDAPLLALTMAAEPDSVALAERLGRQGILTRFIPGTPWLRLSVAAWTTEDELERLATALVG